MHAKWRKSAKQYREKTGGGEPTLKELLEFITAESQTENDPVYGRPSTLVIRANTGRNFKKLLPTSGQSGETHIPTLSTEIKTKEANTPQKDKALSAKGEHVERRGEVLGLQEKAWCFRMFSVRKEGFELAPTFCKIQCTVTSVCPVVI